MSLSSDDLQDIRQIISDELMPLRGSVETLSNDVKEIYEILSDR